MPPLCNAVACVYGHGVGVLDQCFNARWRNSETLPITARPRIQFEEDFHSILGHRSAAKALCTELMRNLFHPFFVEERSLE